MGDPPAPLSHTLLPLRCSVRFFDELSTSTSQPCPPPRVLRVSCPRM